LLAVFLIGLKKIIYWSLRVVQIWVMLVKLMSTQFISCSELCNSKIKKGNSLMTLYIAKIVKQNPKQLKSWNFNSIQLVYLHIN